MIALSKLERAAFDRDWDDAVTADMSFCASRFADVEARSEAMRVDFVAEEFAVRSHSDRVGRPEEFQLCSYVVARVRDFLIAARPCSALFVLRIVVLVFIEVGVSGRLTATEIMLLSSKEMNFVLARISEMEISSSRPFAIRRV